MTYKEKVYQAYQEVLAQKIADVRQILDELFISAASETKSTAGDKHETALAMLQIEQENKRKQLSELQAQQTTLGLLKPLVENQICSPGALVHTSQGVFFVSSALGKLVVEGETIFALSASSPLGKMLAGKRKNEQVMLNGKAYQILNVV